MSHVQEQLKHLYCFKVIAAEEKDDLLSCFINQ